MSSAGFRWFVCGVVAALVVIMLVVVRSNATWHGHTPQPTSAEDQHGGWSGAPAAIMAARTAIPAAGRSAG
jgi:hypothetical protein